MAYVNIPEFLVNAPLYRTEAFQGTGTHQEGTGPVYIQAPPVLDRVCEVRDGQVAVPRRRLHGTHY